MFVRVTFFFHLKYHCNGWERLFTQTVLLRKNMERGCGHMGRREGVERNLDFARFSFFLVFKCKGTVNGCTDVHKNATDGIWFLVLVLNES